MNIKILKTKWKNIDKPYKTIIICGVALAIVCIIISVLVVKKIKSASINTNVNAISSLGVEQNILDENKIEEEIFVESEEEEANEVQEQIQESNTNEINSSSPYYIKINSAANCLTIYSKDENGDYTNPIKAMICSTGDYTPPNGKYPGTRYKISGSKWEWGHMQGDVWAHYVTKITGNILFHSVPYSECNPETLEYWEYDKLGTRASLGCIRLRVVDSKWIYDNIPGGTYVEFYEDGNPGPLGKPSAQKISSNETCRNWDPTDPNPNNAWFNYKEPEKEEKKQPEVKPEKNKKEENKTKKDNNNEIKNVKTNTLNENSTANEISNKTKPIGNNTTIDKNTNSTNTIKKAK